ncbi:STAS domain-containing protein [Vibrio palustris]|uniref:Anti-sigma-B factor antagonist n=1 Tax=Vibrio palustris TaxID=1918946 RepID=A0A1R4B3Y1_9VIBR|nr:STAS domain-containing protein [Vibrio palustris]SJL83624.1 Anti-sigma-B factor antagonist [Vibrio palustris]
MSDSQWHIVSPEYAELQGALDRDTVPKLWESLSQWTADVEQVTVSLASVERVDSAGMAMLIHLIENAKRQNCHIMLSFVPKQLGMLFQLSNIEQMMNQHIKQSTEVNGG